MKYITLALALSITASGFAQSTVSDKTADPCDPRPSMATGVEVVYAAHNGAGTCISVNNGPGMLFVAPSPRYSDPDYIGVVHHSHKLRNGLLLGAGAAIGAVAIGFMATHGSNAPKGTSGQYSTGLNPVPQVFK